MKKKMKLFATISSFGLALAKLVFGVYAATSANFKITTNISFIATKHVKVSISAKDTGAVKVRPDHEANDDFTVDAKLGASQEIGVNKDGSPNGTNNGVIQDIEFYGAELNAQSRFYGYQIIITNLDKENDLGIDLQTPVSTGKGYKIDWYGQTEKIEKNGGVATITCILEVTDLAGNSVNINKDEMQLNVKLGKETNGTDSPGVDDNNGSNVENENNSNITEENGELVLNPTLQLNGANGRITVKKNGEQVGNLVTAINGVKVTLPEVVLTEVGDKVEITLANISVSDFGSYRLVVENQPNSIIVDGVETVTVTKAPAINLDQGSSTTLTIKLNKHSDENIFQNFNLVVNLYEI